MNLSLFSRRLSLLDLLRLRLRFMPCHPSGGVFAVKQHRNLLQRGPSGLHKEEVDDQDLNNQAGGLD